MQKLLLPDNTLDNFMNPRMKKKQPSDSLDPGQLLMEGLQQFAKQMKKARHKIANPAPLAKPPTHDSVQH